MMSSFITHLFHWLLSYSLQKPYYTFPLIIHKTKSHKPEIIATFPDSFFFLSLSKPILQIYIILWYFISRWYGIQRKLREAHCRYRWRSIPVSPPSSMSPKDTVTGFLLAGVGDNTGREGSNYFITTKGIAEFS